VNGYIYPTGSGGGNVYIPNATLSMLKSRQNTVGLITFNDIPGNIVKTPITSDMVFTDSPYTLYQRALIKFPNPVVKPVLILGGYLVFENPQYFYRISDDTYVLILEMLPFIERIYEMQRYRDIFKELQVPVSPNNPSVVDADTLRSDAVITRFLTLFNTFLVETNAPVITTNKIYLQRSNVPESFLTQILPNRPLMAGYGKIVEYVYRQNPETMYTVYTKDSYYNNYLLSYLPAEDISIYNDHRDPRTTYYLSQGFFLDVAFT
jgi:hypothetical protein